jgi:peptidoglycan/xylan/chitin deacetylase (PgdA/CDA1 family)
VGGEVRIHHGHGTNHSEDAERCQTYFQNKSFIYMRKRVLKNPIAFIKKKLLGTVTHFATNEPVVALTFDDGPHPLYTPYILDTLGKFGVYATFFMVGKAAERYPEIVQMVAQAGHAIGNHSWEHKSFTTINGKEQYIQIRACERALSPYGQRIFRPPWGSENLASSIVAFYLRYKVISWNLQVGDWWDRNSQRMADQLISRTRPGSIILLHDSLYNKPYVDREAILQTLNLFLKRTDKKFHFKTIPEMFHLAQPIKKFSFKNK